MVRKLVCVVTAGVMMAASASLLAQGTLRSAQHDYRVVLAEGLVEPWSMAFVPGGDVLITERPGRLRIVRNGKLLAQPVEGVPAVVYAGQGGLLEVALHPDFATNRFLYLT